MIKRLLLAAVLVVVGGCASPAMTAPPTTAAFPNVVPGPEITVAVAAHFTGAFVLDVREPAEWAAGHIAGATLIPLGQLPARLSEVPRDQAVIVVCRTGHRAAQGRDILLRAGYNAVTVMTGGMTEWLSEGEPVE